MGYDGFWWGEYDGFDSNIEFMHIATGWGSTGRWIINVQDDGFKYDKDPSEMLEKVVGRFGTFMGDHLAGHSGFVDAINKKLAKLADRMLDKFDSLNGKCDMWNEPESDDDDGLRYADDPCKAVVQLPKSFLKWSSVYNVNCNSGSMAFVDRVQKDVEKIQKKLVKKLK